MLLLVCFGTSLLAQNRMGVACIMFYPDSDSTFKALDDANQTVASRTYQKFITKGDNGKVMQITFWVHSERFDYLANRQQRDTIAIAEIKSMQFKTPSDMEKDHITSGYFLRSDTYDKVYMLEKINALQVVKYEVQWIDYAE